MAEEIGLTPAGPVGYEKKDIPKGFLSLETLFSNELMTLSRKHEGSSSQESQTLSKQPEALWEIAISRAGLKKGKAPLDVSVIGCKAVTGSAQSSLLQSTIKKVLHESGALRFTDEKGQLTDKPAGESDILVTNPVYLEGKKEYFIVQPYITKGVALDQERLTKYLDFQARTKAAVATRG